MFSKLSLWFILSCIVFAASNWFVPTVYASAPRFGFFPSIGLSGLALGMVWLFGKNK